MNRQQRRKLVGPKIASLAQRIADSEKTWADRWVAFCACLQNWLALAERDNLPREEVGDELGGELARHIITRLGARRSATCTRRCSIACRSTRCTTPDRKGGKSCIPTRCRRSELNIPGSSCCASQALYICQALYI
jgi:hypothetical protein